MKTQLQTSFSDAASSPRHPQRTALLVLGMHRSGTSALTRVLSLLGAALPKNLLGSARGNEQGHWEPERLVNLHDEMLTEAGSRWDDWRRFDPAVLGPERLSHYKTEISRLIEEEYGDASLFVLKDPRICRFVPLYEEILSGMGVAPKFVLAYRNPISVVDSLATRDEMISIQAQLLWLRHVIDSEESTAGKARVFVSYEDCLDDWRDTAGKVSTALRVEWPRGFDEAAQEINTQLSRNLQHYVNTRATLDSDERVWPEIRDAYGALLALTIDEDHRTALETLSNVRTLRDSGRHSSVDANFEELANHIFEEMAVRQNRDRRNQEHLQRLVTKYQNEASREAGSREAAAGETAAREAEARASRSENARLKARNKALQNEYGKARAQNKALQAAYADLRGSTSWRLTRPIRLVKRMTTDPRGTISFLRAKMLNNKPPEAKPPEAKPPEAKPIPGMGRLSPVDAARIRSAFDDGFYCERYPDIVAFGADPFEHYMRFGWKEGRDPSPDFCTSYYLRHAPALAKAGINPFRHWVLHGMREKRQTLPFRRRLERVHYAPKVSAIVPNYNHARFLQQRLDSILDQTYENVEVLILDDCSTDDSRAIIERYCEKHPGRVRALLNDDNSGNVFRQWRKGLQESLGELVWICESDDFCEPNFLESLVHNFKDRSVNIAFGRIQFANRDGELQPGLDGYREGAEPGIWDTPLTRPARQWFAGGFGVNNVIANVGGCVFRRQSLSEEVLGEAEGYSILGDWFLYCHIAGGGQISYEPSAMAYFRQHEKNTSVTSFDTPGYYEEHERLMLLLRRRWGVPDKTVNVFHYKVARQYAHRKLEEKLGPMRSYCDRLKLLGARRTRPHVLICFQGFHPGGGEIFPIHLANALHEQGHLVSMMALDTRDANPEMLDTLNSSIPIYDSDWVEEYGADRFLADAGVSLIHSHIVSIESFFFEKCKVEMKIPYLVTLHGSYEAFGLENERLLRIASGVTQFVYTADKNLEPFQSLPMSEGAFTKLGNAMPEDPRSFPQTRRRLGISEDSVVFTLVARGIQRKGWRASINAFRHLRDANPERNMHLLLCGDGEETSRHLGLHGTDPDITFLGYQSHIHGLYRLSDVAIVPTRFSGESFPLCVIQALQTGTPLVATRHGEIENMIEDSEGIAGIVIEYLRDTDLFTDNLREGMAAMLDPTEREKFASAAKVKGESYSMDKVASDYVTIYESLLAEKT